MLLDDDVIDDGVGAGAHKHGVLHEDALHVIGGSYHRVACASVT
ncbi:MAG: hypothetical protein ACRDV3_14445 [Acidothermaceae bacterium]